jgi:hypothetical protein
MEKRKKRKGYHGWTNLENSSIDFMMMINYGVKMIVLIMMIRYHDGLEFKCQKNNLDGAQQRKKKTIDLGHVMLLITSLLLS